MSFGKINLLLLALVLTLPPLYGAHQRAAALRAAETEAQHKADLARLVVEKNVYQISGVGAPRSDYGECLRDIANFTRNLGAKGFTGVQNVSCVAVEGDSDTYAPTFRALASEPLTTNTVFGGRYNSQSFCEIEAQRMADELNRAGTKVLEVSCKRLHAATSGAEADEMFQPAVTVLEKPRDPASEKPFKAMEALADPAAAAVQQ